MATYRITSEGYIDRDFVLVSRRVIENKGGEDVESDIPVNPARRDVFSAQIHPGDVIRVPDDFPIGEHMEPLDDAARKAFEAYDKPRYHNNLDALEQTMDMRTPEQRIADAVASAMKGATAETTQAMIDVAVSRAMDAATAPQPPRLSLGRGASK